MDRRHMLGRLVCSTSAVWLNGSRLLCGADERRMSVALAYLRSIMPTPERVAQFTETMSAEESRRRSNGWTYHESLGWVHCSAVHSNGVDGSRTFYDYEIDGARQAIHSANSSCRIHCYGDSFTHCDQVSDGETWEEYLAAHLQEPIRNYGVGGYSVYQAYRRILEVEEQHSAEYIVLNIYDDDHYRNLDAWRSIRVGANSQCGFTLPHLRVNVEQDQCEERENSLNTRESVRQLLDEDFVYQTFADDPILNLTLANRAGDFSRESISSLSQIFGVPETKLNAEHPEAQIRQLHTEAALFATRKIVGWTEEFIKKQNKKLLLILTFGEGNMASALAGHTRFDSSFTDWLRDKPYPVIDMRDAFQAAYQESNTDMSTFLKRYYNGHHTPAGNFFFAWSLKDHIIDWLNPKPNPYR
ncbi:MAG: SGNH/GDSL hydrolase family protein [Planctomycetales bacterium]|nr:SGNH/GDSL hydrolase family protein [Planctomycetales bacterium]